MITIFICFKYYNILHNTYTKEKYQEAYVKVNYKYGCKRTHNPIHFYMLDKLLQKVTFFFCLENILNLSSNDTINCMMQLLFDKRQKESMCAISRGLIVR